MKKYAVTTATLLTALTGSAMAADIGQGFDLSGNATITSEYFWRGMDQNSNAAAFQGGLDLAHESGAYIGIWSSPVNFSDGASSEVDYYGGFAFELNSIGIDVGMISYQYPGSIPNSSFEEAYLGLSGAMAGLDVGVTLYEGSSTAESATEFSVGTAVGDFGVSYTYGDYDNTGTYMAAVISKEFLSESFPIEMALMYTEMDFDDATADNEDGLILSASMGF
ncbi:MAG: hypothetical protein CBB82_00770 [Betaproteobacteria bacterium TMED22]|nr:MAG: hypothetical protein CBB82_00770 [Betaproteobacteria bacterium TMED22]|tara:strand:+ start:25759 stop:26424 length:666 start_codon:yes stop_codon:yes gene_type:complete